MIKVRSPLLGAKVANLSPAVAEELRLDYSTEGVVVTDVESGSVAQSFGFQKGDIVSTSTTRRLRSCRTCCGPSASRCGCGGSPSCAAARRSPPSSADESGTQPDRRRQRLPRRPSFVSCRGISLAAFRQQPHGEGQSLKKQPKRAEAAWKTLICLH